MAAEKVIGKSGLKDKRKRLDPSTREKAEFNELDPALKNKPIELDPAMREKAEFNRLDPSTQEKAELLVADDWNEKTGFDKKLSIRMEEDAGTTAGHAPSPAAKETILKSTEKPLGMDEKLRHEPHPVQRDPEADWHDWLRGIAGRAGINDAKLQKAQAAWVDRHFRRKDLLLSQKELERLERGFPLEGAPIELRLKIGVASQEALDEGAARWRRFARTTLAATLRRMEEKSVTPEEEIDVLVRALLPVRGRLRPAAGVLMLAARARMSHQADQREGYYKTRGALADMFSGLMDELSRRRRCFLYWEILAELQNMDAEAIAPGAWASIVNADANNLASTLDDLHLIPASVHWMRQAVIAGSAARMLGEDDAAGIDAHAGLSAFFPEGAPITPEWAALLDDMGNVPETWKHDGGKPSDLAMWLVELATALARAAMRENEEAPRKVAAALFNAGVTVNRGAKSERNVWLAAWECRIVLNGAGLLWVLHHRAGDAPEDFHRAMRRLRGGSCAVNLLGALANRAPSAASGKAELERFVNALYALEQALPGEDFARIEGSVQKLKLKPEAVEENPLPLLDDLVQANLTDPAWLTDWKAFAGRPSPESLGALLARTGKLGHREFATAAQRLADRLGQFEQQARNWPNDFIAARPDSSLLPDWYEGIAAAWKAELDGPGLPTHIEILADGLIHD